MFYAKPQVQNDVELALERWARKYNENHDQEKIAEMLNNPVEKLGLSSRTLNCVKRAHINRIGEVLEREKSDLLKIRNMGAKSVAELLQAVADFMRQHKAIWRRTEGS